MVADANDASDANVVDASVASCPSEGGAMIRIDRPADAGAYCIDATEVTQGLYDTFLATKSAAKIGGCDGDLVPSCTFSATDFDAVNRSAFPVVCVDWCDAVTFCQAYGKRLCGLFADVSADASVNSRSEWFGACSRFASRPYPWGQESARDAGGCNVGTDASAPVAAERRCQGASMGLFDMIGNVREWEDDCDSGSCRYRGGGFSNTPSSTNDRDVLHCANLDGAPMSTRERSTGFRCCADLP